MPMLPFEFFRLHGSVLDLAERSSARLGLLDLCFRDQLRVVCREGRGCEYDATDKHGQCTVHMLHLDEGPDGRSYIRRVRIAVITTPRVVHWSRFDRPAARSFLPFRCIVPRVGGHASRLLKFTSTRSGLVSIKKARDARRVGGSVMLGALAADRLQRDDLPFAPTTRLPGASTSPLSFRKRNGLSIRGCSSPPALAHHLIGRQRRILDLPGGLRSGRRQARRIDEPQLDEDRGLVPVDALVHDLLAS